MIRWVLWHTRGEARSHLFSFYTENKIKEVEVDLRKEEFYEPSMQKLRVGNLRYGDERALISTTPKCLESLTNKEKDQCQKISW